METYKGEINEFVDWVSGIDELTGNKISGVSDDTPISGQSIRELVQGKLKKPFVKYDDPTNGQYIFFSSDEAKDKWLELTDSKNVHYDPEKASTIPITTMPRPSDTVLQAYAVSDNQAEPYDLGNSRYITSGDKTSPEANIKYIVTMTKQAGGVTQNAPDGFITTFTITDANGGVSTVVDDRDSIYVTEGSERKILEFNCYKYLTEGTNTIKVQIIAKNSTASFSTNITVYLVKFTLSSSFSILGAIQPNAQFAIPVVVNSSITGLPLTLEAKISDGSAVNKVFQSVGSRTISSPDNPYTGELYVVNAFPANTQNEDHITHTLTISATLGQNGSTTFTSNVLAFTFQTASSSNDIVNKFINIKYDTPANLYDESDGHIILHAVQYEEFKLDWAYYTDHLSFDAKGLNIYWYLRYKDHDTDQYVEQVVFNGIGDKGNMGDQFRFIPEVYQTQEDGAELIVKYYKNGQYHTIETFPIIITKSQYTVNETSGAVFKISAFGKSNDSNDKNKWIDSISGATTTFTNFPFDDRCGWHDNALVVQGTGSYATINYCPIHADGAVSSETLAYNGKTIEIEFTPTKSNNDDDVLIKIGDNNAGHIDIKPNGAYLYVGESTADKVHTNYKVGERTKLAFVFNRSNSTSSPDNRLVYIINNGILERAADMGTSSEYGSNYGNIVIGGTQSGVAVYNIRIYDQPLSYTQELSNYIYDCLDKSEIISRNQLYENEQLVFSKVKNKIDSILIEGIAGQKYGGLTKLFDPNTRKDEEGMSSETTVNIKRTCISDDTKSFYVKKAMIRKHGQSTLNYPITSLKFWLNKSATTDDNPTIEEISEQQRILNLNKNRYVMKDGAIPANKFVLQANYADSSGTHNGSLLRLINDTWYNANFGTVQDPIYRLRTAPQLFTSGNILVHNNANIGENGTWIEGYGVGIASNKTWPEIAKDKNGNSIPFPYQIRNAADSFPCAVFYKDPNGDGNEHFLGQYVFMDDKKSDFIYGERSIYAFGDYTDPFVMNIDNTKNGKNHVIVNGKAKGQDIDDNKVWDNNHVLRIETVLLDTPLTSFMGMNVPTTLTLTDDGIVESTSGEWVDCRDIRYDKNGNPLNFYWEDYFEMIYPDPDDIDRDDNGVITKFNANSKFRQTAQPFIDFLTWITGISALNVDGSNNQYTNGTVNQAALNKFKQEAHDHLDLYKLAAYYIFFLRFGLVDSVERNSQLKTYDGQHWHYEPWDMDIAMGNTNQGALVFNPPLTRDSVIPGTSTKAFSGRTQTTSNFLWDCLEAWDEWANKIVPEVAEKLYNAGLSYENAIKVFDDEYSDKWAESLYNEAGYFKYIQNGGGSWLPWLQGSRKSHRHWWLSTSMNYYDAKWSCGTFKNRRVILFVNKDSGHSQGTDIVRIKPTSNTYFEIVTKSGETSVERKSATPTSIAEFDVSSNGFSAKDPTWIYGGLFIDELDLSCFANTMAAIDVSACYDKVLGANIKSLNVGVPTTTVSSTEKSGFISGTPLRITAENRTENTDAFNVLETLDITGQTKFTQDCFVQYDRSSIKNFYAIGTQISSFENAPSGNTFHDLVLPATTDVMSEDGTQVVSKLSTLILHSAKWDNLEFWNTQSSAVPQPVMIIENGEQVQLTDENGTPVYRPVEATFTKQSTVPADINRIEMRGSTANNENSFRLIFDWIDSISTGAANSTEIHNRLQQKNLIVENINWPQTFLKSDGTRLTYNDLENLAYINGITNGVFNNTRGFLKGYVVISGSLTAQQIVNIKKWFGDSAFDKSAVTSQLVVDCTSNEVVINIDGTTVVNNEVTLEEGGTASMRGTKFLLGDTIGENFVIEAGQQIQQDQFIWSISDGTDFDISNVNNLLWGNSFKSCTLEYNQNDGRMKLVTEDGAYGDYYVAVRVMFLNDYGVQDYAYLVIKIIGTTYPSGYNVSVQGSNIRPFYVDNVTYRSIFPSYYQFDGNYIADNYVLYSANQSFTITVTPQGTYTARIKSVDFQIYKQSTQTNVSSASGWLSIAAVNATGITEKQGSDEYVGYNGTGGAYNSICIKAGQTLPETCTGYQVRIRVMAGASEYYKYINVIAISDNTPILVANSTNGAFLAINAHYNDTYSTTNQTSLYKTHLMGIYGNVDFGSYASNFSTLQSALGDCVLLYMPNVEGLDLTDCTQLNYSANSIDLSNCSKLTTLSLNGCVNVTGVLNITGATSLTSVDLKNTTIGISVPENSVITMLELGTPETVHINGPTSLTTSGISIQSKTDLNGVYGDLELIGVNKTSLCGFTMFNNLYGGS